MFIQLDCRPRDAKYFQEKKLRVCVFGHVAEMPMTAPFVKIAMIKWAYRQPVKSGWCIGPDAPKLRAMTDEILQPANTLLKAIHGLGKDMKHLSVRDQDRILCNCDIGVAEGLLTPPKSCIALPKRKEALATAVLPHLRQSQKLIPDVKLCRLLPDFLKDEDLFAEQSVTPSDKISPVVIMFDEHGAPTNSQDVRVEPVPQPETLSVQAWFEMESVQTRLLAARAKSTVHASLLAFASATMPLVLAKVKLTRLGSLVCVVAATDFAKGALLLPCLALGNNLAERSLHPHAVRLQYLVLDEHGTVFQRCSYDLSPELQLPKPAAAGGGGGLSEQHNPNLFWAMKRTHVETEWNCEVHNVLTQAIVVTSFQGNTEFLDERCHGINGQVEVPVITNTRTVRAGEELVLRWRAPIEKERKVKERSWITDQRDAKKKMPPSKA